MKKHFNVLLIVFIMVFLVSCKEEDKLREDNLKLKEQINQLTTDLNKTKAELEDLRQTDMYLYSQAEENAKAIDKGAPIEKLKEFATKTIEYSEKLLIRFPNSQYGDKAKELKRSANTVLATVEKISSAVSEIDKNINAHDFYNAKNVLNSIKPSISKEDYERFAKAIEDEQDKPVSVTVLDLNAEPEKYCIQNVVVSGYISSNYSDGKSFTLSGNQKDITPSVDIDYSKLPIDELKIVLSTHVRELVGPSVTVTGVFGCRHGGSYRVRAKEVIFN
jgi:hypothetical protein